MPVNILKDSINTISYPSVSNTLMTSDTNIIVPDSKPDAREVTFASVRPAITEKKVQKDYITLSGVLDYELIYQSEGDEGHHRIGVRVPFTHQLEMSGGEEAQVSVKCSVDSITATAVNSRKINIKSTVDFETNGVFPTAFEVVSGGGCELPCRTASVPCTSLAFFCEREFEVGGGLAAGGGAPSEILATHCWIDSKEIKFINGKPVAKGVVRAVALYRDEEGALCTAEGDFPFTEPLGYEGESTSWELEFTLTDGGFTTEANGEGASICANFTYTLCAFVYQDGTAEITSDIYSPDYDLEVDSRDLTFCHITGAKEECPVKETIPLMLGGEAVAVFSAAVTPGIEDIRNTPSGAEAVGKSAVRLCCIDREGRVYTVTRELPFTCALGVFPKGEDDRISVAVEAECISAGLISPTVSEVKFTLCFATQMATHQTLPCICDVRAVESAEGGAVTPSVVIYFPAKGEKLWDIAKRYRTTSDAIAGANDREFGEVFGGDEVVMIPRRN